MTMINQNKKHRILRATVWKEAVEAAMRIIRFINQK